MQSSPRLFAASDRSEGPIFQAERSVSQTCGRRQRSVFAILSRGKILRRRAASIFFLRDDPDSRGKRSFHFSWKFVSSPSMHSTLLAAARQYGCRALQPAPFDSNGPTGALQPISGNCTRRRCWLSAAWIALRRARGARQTDLCCPRWRRPLPP
jgi:hypothetical protein